MALPWKIRQLLFLFALWIPELLAAAVNLAQPIPVLKLTDGRTLKNARLVRFNPDSVLVRWDGGGGTIRYEALPAEIRSEAIKKQPVPSTRTEITVPNDPDEYVAMVAKGMPIPAEFDGKPNYQPAATRSTITGQAFVTTKGGQNIKLGGVEITLVPKEMFDQFISWMDTEGDKPADYFAHYRDVASQQKRHDIAVKFAQLVVDLRHAEWESLPVGTHVTTTDADGKFRLEHDYASAFVVFAKAHREIGDSTEHYVWAVPSKRIPASGELLLHNANMQ